MSVTSELKRPGAHDVERLVEGMVHVLETGEGAAEVFAPDAVFDLNVPAWRFQVRGAAAFDEWWHQEVQHRGRVTVGRSAATSSGFVLEVSIEFEFERQELYARQLILADVSDGRVTNVVLYCTGDWDAGTRARQAVEAPMIRR